MSGRAAKPRRRPGAHARRPGPGLRVRVRRSLPPPGRTAAVLLLATLVAGLVVLVNGPWLRVDRVAWAGDRYTSAAELERVLADLDGEALLTVDATGIAAELQRLPAVAEARVAMTLPGTVSVTIVEREATFVWQTSAVRLIGSSDGTLIGQLALGATLPEDLASLPLVEDQRIESRNIIVGDAIDDRLLDSALRLAAVEPSTLGSATTRLGVRLTDADGFLLVSVAPAWQASFGYYAPADDADRVTLDERVEAQVAAVRTLFSQQPETGVSWVDVRNPGRVYWRP